MTIKNSIKVKLVLISGLFAFALSCDQGRDPRYGAILFKQSEASLGSVYGDSVHKTTDGGTIVAGKDGGGLWLAKIDSDSNVQWEKRCETGGREADLYNTHMVLLPGGGYAIATVLAHSYGNGSTNTWLLELDSSGNVQWEKSYLTEKNSFVGGLVKASDGGYILGGEAYSVEFDGNRGWLMKVDSTGSIIWHKLYGQSEEIRAIKDLGNGLYLAAGGGTIMTFNENGSVVQSTSYGVAKSITEITEADVTPDGGYICTGNLRAWNDGDSTSNIIILKFDSGLNLLWQKVLDFNSNDSKGWYIETTSDGGAILTGLGWAGIPILTNLDVFCMKISGSGSIEWNKFYDLGIRGVEQSFMIHETADGYITSGNVSTQGFVMAMNSSGDIPGSDITVRSATISEKNISLSILSPVLETIDAVSEETVTSAEVSSINSEITKL
ncbi:MAG: hypothetical protein GY754_00290 [bacterium]|nr:hypothetical protein [bacterium]